MKRFQCLAASLLFLAGCGVSSTTNLPAPQAQPKTAPESSENTTTDSGEEKPAVPAEDEKTRSKTASETATNASVDEVALVDDDGSLFAKYLEENKGKVILVDCWATWCAPCMAGFPKTVALHEKYKDKGLVVVSVSFDDMGDDEEEKKARRDEAFDFLKKKKAAFKNFLARTGIGSDSGTPFGVTINLPAFRVIDRQGKDRLDPKLSHEEIEKQLPDLVATLLNEPG
jgi:thiol-disulfide isomerase/thioredoxin